MKYFTELLESYSKLKKRTLKLFEQEGFDPAAKAKADAYIGQADSLKSNPSPTNRVQVKEHPGTEIWVTPKGKTVYNGFGSQVVDVNSNSNPKGYQKFVNHFLTSGQQPQTDLSPEGQQLSTELGGQPGIAQETTYPWIDGNAFIDEASYTRAIEKVCSANKKECEELRNAYSKFLNSGKTGTIAYTISRTRYSVEGCPENDPLCKAQSNPNASTLSKESAARTLQKSLQLLTKDAPLTEDEKLFLERNINLSQSNQILLVDRSTGKGLMITQGRRTELYRVLDQLSKTKGVNLLSDKKNFIRDATHGGGASSAIRGFFYEDLRKAAIELNKCKTIDQKEIGACQRRAAESFERWKDKQDLLRDSFQDLVNQYSQDGEVAIDTQNNLDMFLMNTVLMQLGKGNIDNADQAFKAFTYRMTRLSQLGATLRNPSEVVSTAADVGEGRKADLREFYNSIDEAKKALDQMGLSKFSEMISQEPNGKFSIGDSLKFSTAFEQVDAGQMSTENMLETLKSPVGTPRHKLLESMGITDVHKKFITKELNQVIKMTESMSQIPKVSEYLDNEGNLKKNASREKILKTIEDHLRSEDLFNGLTSDLQRKIKQAIESEISKGKKSKVNWEELCLDISKTYQKQRFANMLQSKNPKERQSAMSFIVGAGVLAGGSADNAMLTVVDAVKGKMHITNQNSSLQRLSSLITEAGQEDFNPDSIQITSNFFKIMPRNPDGSIKKTGFDYQIHFDGSTSHCHINTSIIEDKTKEGSDSGKTFKLSDVSKIGKGMEPPKRTDASHKLAKIGINLAEAIKKYSETLKLITD